MSVSVIIPSYNSAKTIRRALEALARQTVAPSEVFVADSSTDETAELVREVMPAAKLVHLETRTMPALARNRAAAEARSETLAFLDADAFPEDDWIERVVEARRAGCRAGGGSIVLPEFQRGNALAAAQYFLQFNEFMPSGGRRRTRFAPSCNLFCERALFEELGGFPAVRASEDVLFGLRAGEKAPFWFVPAARVHHVFREEWKPFVENQRLLGRYIFLYRRAEETGKFYYRGAWPALLLPAFVAIKLAFIAGRVLRSGTPATAAQFLFSLPVFFAGLWAWAGGFLAATREPRTEVPA